MPPDALAPPTSPTLEFAVDGAEAVEYAAVPTLRFPLRVRSDVPIRSLTLNVQLRIAATRRRYDAEARERLHEVFGPPEGWARALRSLLWAQVHVVVPGFSGETRADLNVPCTYDFEVVAAKYLAALPGGDVPLEFLFSGTAFHLDGEGLLRTARVSWDREAELRMPLATWRRAMDLHFPDAAWVRLERETFDRLAAFRAEHVHMSWDETMTALLDRAATG